MPNPALTDSAAWLARLRDAPLPVLAATMAELEALRQAEDEHGRVDAHLIGEAIDDDPLMIVRLFADIARHRPAAQVTDAETVVASLVHLGVGPFFRRFAAMPTVEQMLQDWPQALEGLQRTLRRSHRAARLALGFAVQRMDTDADIVREATLVHDFAELLLWCHAPQAMLAQPADAAAAPEPGALGQLLMRAWRLPTLLIELTDAHQCHNPLVEPQRQTVQLALRLARVIESGWDDPALPELCAEAAGLLHLSVAATTRLVHELDELGD